MWSLKQIEVTDTLHHFESFGRSVEMGEPTLYLAQIGDPILVTGEDVYRDT
jgi:hypothetical protein